MTQPQKLLIGAGVAAALIGAFFALRPKPVEVQALSPRSLKAMPTLARIEITTAKESKPDAMRSEDAGQPSPTITLARVQGTWRMVSPRDSELSELFLRDLVGAFDKDLGADDIPVSPTRAQEVGLSEDRKTVVRFILEGQEQPAQTLILGDAFTPPGTRARRTYVKYPEDDRIYRLQGDLSFLQRRYADELRSKVLVKLPPESIKKITLQHRGQAPITLERDAERWQHVQTDSPVRIDAQTVDFLINGLTSLSVTKLTDDLKPEEVGLDDPEVTLTVQGDSPIEQPLTLRLSPKRVESEPEPIYYVQRADRPGVYPISRFSGGHLTPDMTRLRDLHPRPIDRDSITGVSFLDMEDGSRKVVLERDGEQWRMTSPVKSDVVDSVQIRALLDYLSNMRIGRYARDGEANGLDEGAQRVEITTTQGPVALLIGGPVQGEQDMVWGKFSDAPMPFVLTKYMMRQFKPALNTLLPPDKLKELGLEAPKSMHEVITP